MSNLNNDAERNTYLTLFESHLIQIKSQTTKDEILKNWKKKRCTFAGLLKCFKGDVNFKNQRKYFLQHKDRDLLISMLNLINKTFKEV